MDNLITAHTIACESLHGTSAYIRDMASASELLSESAVQILTV